MTHSLVDNVSIVETTMLLPVDACINKFYEELYACLEKYKGAKHPHAEVLKTIRKKRKESNLHYGTLKEVRVVLYKNGTFEVIQP